MTLREDMAADAQAAWFDTDGLAQPVTYKVAATGLESSINAVPVYGEGPASQDRYLVEELSVLVSRAAVAAPRDGDTVTVAGTVWTVRRVLAGDALEISWRLHCTKRERATLRRAP